MNSISFQQFEWQEAGKRFRFAGIVSLVFGLVTWSAWFYPFDDLIDRSGTPLGGDYVMLYVSGQVIADGQANLLYDDRQNQMRSAALFPAMDPDNSWPFRYPPTVAALMAPLSLLPFTWSYGLFFLIQLLILGTALILFRIDFLVLQSQPDWMWAIAGSPFIVETLIGGQSSLIALAVVLGFAHCYGKRNDFTAGALLALALYKPNVLALFILGCLVARPRLLVGFVPAAVVGVVIALLSSGPEELLEYLRLGSQLASSTWSLEPPYWKVHGLAPYFQMFQGEYGKLLCFCIGGFLSLLFGLGWHLKFFSDHAAMAMLLWVNSLLNPYVPIYDLVLLVLAVTFGCEAARRGEFPTLGPRTFQLLAAVLFLGPHLSQALAKEIGVQLFPVAVLASFIVFTLRFFLPSDRNLFKSR